jgi:hypothetical protein
LCRIFRVYFAQAGLLKRKTEEIRARVFVEVALGQYKKKSRRQYIKNAPKHIRSVDLYLILGS